MKPTHKITPPDWMTAPATAAVLAALNGTLSNGAALTGGTERQALFVGGCVRNALRGLKGSDIDIATVLTPDRVMQRLQQAGIKALPTGIDHGTVTAVLARQHFEITTLRRDVATDGRRAVVAFTTDWAADAARRDFTMNTLLADAQGNIYDPLGSGVRDALAGRVIFVGDPAARIAEDYLRIMRFFRFHALYGRGAVDESALAACRAAAAHLKSLSRERLTQETLKILAVDDPAPTLGLMFENHVALFLRGDVYNAAHLSSFCALQNQYGRLDVTARLAALSGFEAARLAAHLALSNAQMKFIRALCALAHEGPALNAPKVRDLVYEAGTEITTQYLLWRLAQEGESETGQALLRIAQTFSPPKFPLTGEDAMKLGLKPGVQMGQLLAEVQAWWRAQDFAPDYRQCLARLTQRAQASTLADR